MKIPIRNIYFLLSYAWGIADELPWEKVGASDDDHPVELLARLLIATTDRLIRRGPDRGYCTREEELKGVRGRIDLARTLKRMGTRQARLTCQFDDLSYAVPHNEVIKATLQRLSYTEDLDVELREQAFDLAHRMQEVPSKELTSNLFSQVHLHGNVRQYRLPISICQMLMEELLPNQTPGHYQFAKFSEERMFQIFESFLQSFFKRHCGEVGYSIAKRERFPWQQVDAVSEDLDLLPTMETDLSLLTDERRIVIESKFYKKALSQSKYLKALDGKLISGHLYQLFAYLRNLEIKDSRVTAGILVYPANGIAIDSKYELHGHSVLVRTVDLGESPTQIKASLLKLVASVSSTTRNQAICH